jgi:hypothetical protein
MTPMGTAGMGSLPQEARPERQVHRPMRENTPGQIKPPYALWSRTVVELVAERFGIRIPVRSAQKKPERIRRYFQHGPGKYAAWCTFFEAGPTAWVCPGRWRQDEQK